MGLERDPNWVPLQAALMLCAGEELSRRVRAWEACLSDDTLSHMQVFRFAGTTYAAERQPIRYMDEQESVEQSYRTAFNDLIRRLRNALECGDLHAAGVSALPEVKTEYEAIPGVWAADYHFNWTKGTIEVRNRRFVAVRISQKPLVPSAPPAGAVQHETGVPRVLRPEDVADLSDEAILALLEEHARRVIAGPDARLIAPGKVSFLPIVKGKLRHRAEHGELLPTLTAEARWLADWVASKVTFHQLPTSKTIGKVLSSEYAVLKTRSKAAITGSKL